METEEEQSESENEAKENVELDYYAHNISEPDLLSAMRNLQSLKAVSSWQNHHPEITTPPPEILS